MISNIKLRDSCKYNVFEYIFTSNRVGFTSEYKLKCCEFKGKQASKIETTSLCCRSYSVLHVRDQKNEWSVFVDWKVSGPLSCPSASQVPRRRAVDGYINNQDSSWPIITNNTPRDWSLITETKLFVPNPPPSTRLKRFSAPPLL